VKRTAVITCLMLFVLSSICFASQGHVAYVDDYQELIVIENQYGDYTLAEIYSGYPYPSQGDRIYGNLQQYGFTNWYCPETNISYRVYIDDYYCSKDDVLEWLFNR
jgi:hypothetical protein